MKTLILIGTMVFLISNLAHSQNQIFTDSTGKKNLVGTFSWEEWQKEMNWKLDSAVRFDDSKILEFKKLSEKLNLEYLIFGGSWCGDTHEGLPIIMEIFSKAGISKDKFTLFGVDRKKFEPTYSFAEYQIEKVPTLIILLNKKEIGRIVETPEKDWISDLLNIINNK